MSIRNTSPYFIMDSVKGVGQRGVKLEVRGSQRGRSMGRSTGEVKGGRSRGKPSHPCYHGAAQRKTTVKNQTKAQGSRDPMPPPP